jgi:hypothetical protein
MVQSNAIVFGWNRPHVGRETMAGELFAHVVNHLDKLKTSAKIDGYEPVFLASHGGDLNGFFLIRGSHAQLDTLVASDEFVDMTLRASQLLSDVGVIHAYIGAEVPNLMSRWTKSIPQR